MPNNPLTLDIINYIETVKTERKNITDTFLLDLVNEGYDTYEYIIEGLPDKIKNLSKQESETILTNLKRIKEQSTTLLDLLEPLEIDTKNMSRVESIYGTMEEEIHKLIRKINLKLKSI